MLAPRSARPRGLSLVPLVAMALLLITAVPASAVSAGFFSAEASAETVLSEMTLHPAAIHVGTVTYIGFQGAGYDPYIAAYDEATGVWSPPARIAPGPLYLDAHGAPSLFVDSAGYIHAIFGGHNSAMQHYVTNSPGKIAAGWRRLADVWANGTYPQPVHLGGDRWMVGYRQGGSPGGIAYRTGREDGSGGIIWDAGSTVLLKQTGPYNAPGTYNWYSHWEAGRNGTVLGTFVLRTPDALEWVGRRNVYYMWRDAGGTWRNVDGNALKLPLDPQGAFSQCLVYDSKGATCNELVVKDAAGEMLAAQPQPLIQFNTGGSRWFNSVRWKFAHRTGSRWEIADVAGTDHSFDSGTFQPRPDGSVDSWLVCGSNPSLYTRNAPLEGRGGTLVRWHSKDRGATWSQVGRVSPAEEGSLFGDPQLVEGSTPTSTIVFTSWTNDPTDFFQRVYLWGSKSGLVRRSFRPSIERRAGDQRVATSLSISRRAFPEGARAVVLARADAFPDALSAAPLAHALRGPVLLVPRWGVPADVLAEIARLKPSRAVLIGSSKVLSDRVFAQLEDAGIKDVKRIGGVDRYETAEKVARELRRVVGPLGTAVYVDGRNFPDALSVAPLAAYNGFPILLAHGAAVPTSTAPLLRELHVTSTLVIGSKNAVSTGFAAGLPTMRRIEGPGRYETSAEVARYALAHGLLPDRFVLASGADFPDAVSGSVLAARLRAPVLLTEPSQLSTATAQVLADNASRTIQAFVLGSEAAVAASPVERAARILKATIRPLLPTTPALPSDRSRTR